MKKIFVSLLVAASIFATAQAQTSATIPDATQDKSAMTRADKEGTKAKKEADLMEAFTKAGLTTAEQEKARAILTEFNDKTKPIKADASLSEDDKKAKLDAIYQERNEQLKAAMGADKYKAFKAAQKAQKEAAKPAAQ